MRPHRSPSRERANFAIYKPYPMFGESIIEPLIGQPDKDHISTSCVERQNLSVRMECRRFTRLTKCVVLSENQVHGSDSANLAFKRLRRSHFRSALFGWQSDVYLWPCFMPENLVCNVSLKRATQVCLACHHKVIQAFAPNRADQPLDVSVPPR